MNAVTYVLVGKGSLHAHASNSHSYIGTVRKGSSHAQTLKQVEDFEPIFASRKKFLPKHSDLSFYNWDTNFSTSNSTPNYQV